MRNIFILWQRFDKNAHLEIRKMHKKKGRDKTVYLGRVETDNVFREI